MRQLHTLSALVAVLLLALPATAGDLDGFMGQINIDARADLGRFRADLSATFNVSSGEVDGLFKVFDSPADVYLTLRLGELCEVPIDRVVTEYRSHRGQGWGTIAKSLGIKPGSAEFHALKNNRLASHDRSTKPGHAAGNGKGKSKKR